MAYIYETLIYIYIYIYLAMCMGSLLEIRPLGVTLLASTLIVQKKSLLASTMSFLITWQEFLPLADREITATI
jgi:hypothetical protein